MDIVSIMDFRGSVQCDVGRVSYIGSSAQQPGDFIHQKDRQTLVAYAEVLRREPASILEIGIYGGGSLALWNAIYPRARIVGVDMTLERVPPALLQALRQRGVVAEQMTMPNAGIARFGTHDVIIDDGAHGRGSVATSFALCWPLLNPGGIYIVEDWHLKEFDPKGIAGDLGALVIGHDNGEHFCDGPFPAESAERVEVRRRFIAVFKRKP